LRVKTRVVTSLKYAKVERERRWVLADVPYLPDDVRWFRIADRYVHGTRLRLREVTEPRGAVIRKLGHKVRIGDDAREVAHTSLYLDDAEWEVLTTLPAAELVKVRLLVPGPEGVVAVDVFEHPHPGLILAEIDAGDGPARDLPPSYEVLAEVTGEEEFTGAALARRRPP